jgi:hypothetical protein
MLQDVVCGSDTGTAGCGYPRERLLTLIALAW